MEKKKKAKKPRSADDASSSPAAPRAAAPDAPSSAVPLAPIAALPPLDRETRWIDRAIVALSALFVFGRALPFPLVRSWDDGRFLIDDPLVTQPSLDALRSIWTEPHFEAYHPLHLMSYWLDVPLLGAVGWSVRATSLALFVCVGFAMLAWLRALGVGRFAALLATIAFVVHPVQVELVVWGTGRKDVLAELFGLLAWSAHLRSRTLWDRDAWISRALFAAACLSKTSAVTLPLAMLATDLWLARRPPRDALVQQVPALALAGVLGAITIVIWQGHEMIRPVERGGPGAELVLASISHAMETFFLPARVSPIYPLVADAPPSLPYLALGTAVVIGSLALAWRARATTLGRTVGAGVTTFVALYLPVSNLIPTYYEFQDRHLSLPLLGVALVLAALLDRGRTLADAERRPTGAVLVLGLACVLPLGLRTMQYEGVWSSDARLWAHATSTHPRAYYAWMKLGEVRRDEGRFDGAIDAYDQAIRIRPNQQLAYAALLMVLARRDERDEAIVESHADELTAMYLRDVDDPDELSSDAGDAALWGYRWAALMFLSRQLDLRPVSDERLEHAADVQLRLDHEWLARFYIGRMSHPPLMPRMRAFWEQERERLGIPALSSVPPPEPPAER